MKEAKDFTEATKLFHKPEGSSGWMQWKGTDVCMDLCCSCGTRSHIDGMFGYNVQCPSCGQCYAASPNVELIKVEPVDSMVLVGEVL